MRLCAKIRAGARGGVFLGAGGEVELLCVKGSKGGEEGFVEIIHHCRKRRMKNWLLVAGLGRKKTCLGVHACVSSARMRALPFAPRRARSSLYVLSLPHYDACAVITVDASVAADDDSSLDDLRWPPPPPELVKLCNSIDCSAAGRAGRAAAGATHLPTLSKRLPIARPALVKMVRLGGVGAPSPPAAAPAALHCCGGACSVAPPAAADDMETT